MNNILIDSSWNGNTGIGRVYMEYIQRLPADLHTNYLQLSCRKNNPLYPVLLTRALRTYKNNVFWSPGFYPPFLQKIRTVITVHDLTHLHYYSKLHNVYYNQIIKALYKKVDLIITVSDYTRNELLNWAGLKPEQVVMIHNGVSSEFTPEGSKIDLGWPFLFYPGNRRIYKNIYRLICAYAKSDAPKSGIRLLLTGDLDEWVAGVAARNNVSGLVVCTGNITDHEIPAYYRSSLAVVFVSLYEGFGLPVLEGLASGVPVITSNVSSLPEVAGDAALLVNPFQVDGIMQGINDIIFNPSLRNHLVQRGMARIKHFSWDESAEKLWKLVMQVPNR